MVDVLGLVATMIVYCLLDPGMAGRPLGMCVLSEPQTPSRLCVITYEPNNLLSRELGWDVVLDPEGVPAFIQTPPKPNAWRRGCLPKVPIGLNGSQLSRAVVSGPYLDPRGVHH